MPRGPRLFRVFRGRIASKLVGLWLALTVLLAAVPTTFADALPPTPADAPRLVGAGFARPAMPLGFNRVDLGWISFVYPPNVRERIQPLIEESERARLDFTEQLGPKVLRSVEVRIARSAVEMSALAPEGAPFPKYASGVAYGQLGLILLTLQPPQANQRLELREVFLHELSHIALHDATLGQHVPRWFNEGFAIFNSGESSVVRLQTLWTASLAGDLIALEQLDRRFPDTASNASIAYAQAADVTRYLVRSQDRYRFDQLIERLANQVPFESALESSYGITLRELESEWKKDVARRYSFWPVLTSAGLLWGVVVGLFFFGYRRRTKRAKLTLERWRREEELEDARRSRQKELENEGLPVHIVFGGSAGAAGTVSAGEAAGEVPTVRHGGHFHTLH
jgi:hypothetical protein